MDDSARSKCLRSIAHLKVETSLSDSENEITLSERESPFARALGHGLLEMYVVDEGDRFEYVQQRDVADADFSTDLVREKALRNLAEIAERKVQVRPYGAIYAVIGGGNHEASMLLLDVFWDEWYKRLAPNGFVAAFPARDLLSFADAASTEGIDELRSLLSRAKGNVDHPLSDRLFRRVGRNWTPIQSS
jgi:hypothetical protein